MREGLEERLSAESARSRDLADRLQVDSQRIVLQPSEGLSELLATQQDERTAGDRLVVALGEKQAVRAFADYVLLNASDR